MDIRKRSSRTAAKAAADRLVVASRDDLQLRDLVSVRLGLTVGPCGRRYAEFQAPTRSSVNSQTVSMTI
jgi:hypothetical protein